jgi:hypothetical protein
LYIQATSTRYTYHADAENKDTPHYKLTLLLEQVDARRLTNSPTNSVSIMARRRILASDFSSFHAPDSIYCHIILVSPRYSIGCIWIDMDGYVDRPFYIVID